MREISASIWSSVPCLVSHAAQSSAWIFECTNRTCTLRRGHCFRSAYMRRVILVHAPRADNSNSYGLGPTSLPPESRGSSAWSRCGPTEMFWAYVAFPEFTITVLGIGHLLPHHAHTNKDFQKHHPLSLRHARLR